MGSVLISPQYVAIAPGQRQIFQALVQGGGSIQWLVNGISGGNDHVGRIDSSGDYTAPANLQLSTNVVVTAALTNSSQSNYATAVASIVNPGVVAPTANPQVAIYSIYLPAPGGVSIDFGTGSDYGLSTSLQTTPSPNGGEVSIYVAGMRASTRYHMRAQVVLNDGASFFDLDNTFTAGTPPVTAAVASSTVIGQIPQPGIEMFDTLIPQEGAQAFATDLQGNVIWTYSVKDGTKMDTVQPIKQLQNGDFLVLISYASSIALTATQILPGTIDAVREIDLVGNTVREITQSQLAGALAARGYALSLGSFHHDVLALPNGHWLLLATVSQSFDNLPGYSANTTVLGDVLIDIDQNNQPTWVWNAFDHLDVTRHPYLFPDWTHSNALLYSADDHNLILSMRHQNWILKIDFEDGRGSGDVLWHLGENGDFKLIGGLDPTDWFYAQHGPDFFSSNTSGIFRLGVMDNGDDRMLPDGTTCGVNGSMPCYSTVPVYEVNESAMTATQIYRHKIPQNLYSYFGGNVQSLANGDLKVDISAPAGGSVVEEFAMQGPSAKIVWQATTSGTVQYRTQRLPSLYPGIQW